MIPYISYELSAAISKPPSQIGNQTGESNNPRLGTTYDVKRAENQPSFRLRFCGFLIALILAIVVSVSLVVAYLPDLLLQRPSPNLRLNRL